MWSARLLIQPAQHRRILLAQRLPLRERRPALEHAEVVDEEPAVQVVAWRMLEWLGRSEDWARDALDEVFLDEAVESWALAEKL